MEKEKGFENFINTHINMTTKKNINANGRMSNLVGMWAFIWQNETQTLQRRVFILGKANDEFYIVQAIGINGEPNICKLVELQKMLNWTFYPTKEIADECYDDYLKNKSNRYVLDI